MTRKRQRRCRLKYTPDKKKAEQEKARKRMVLSRKKQNEDKRSEVKRINTLRRRHARNLKSLSSSFENTNNGIDIHQHSFDVFQKSLTWYCCNICNKKQIFSLSERKPCSDCNLFSISNDLDPMNVPPELQDLTFIEQQLIARIHPVVSLYKVKNVQYKYTGQVINFPQNIHELTSVLPHKVSDLTGALAIRLENSDGYRDFFINKDKVLSALVWLKRNNPFYSDITICHDRLEQLPEGGSVYKLLRGYDVDESEQKLNDTQVCTQDVIYQIEDDDDTSEVSPIIFKDVPDLSYVSQRDQLNINDNVLLWPSIGKTPINEFSSPGYITMSFPHLFPYGTCDYSNRKNNKISLDKYVQHLMLYKDGRFAQDPRFRFFMLNSMMRWQALKLGNIFVKQNSFFNKMTVYQLKEHLRKHPKHLRDILFYSRRIRSTKAYWKSRCSELEDMVKQIGAPTIFFTLSSADYHWSELYRLLGCDDPNLLSYFEKSKLLSDNPLIVTTFFKLRVQYFLKNSFSDYFDVNDYWYRTEFQSRGSSHIHGVVWLKNAPDILNINTEKEKDDVLDFFSKLVKCQNPDLSIRPNLHHPCSKLVSDVENLDDDLAELVNRVQRHTCSASYCLKQRNKVVKNCRFGFPKELQEKSEICENSNQIDILFERNDMFVNNYNAWVLQTWRSNIDFSPILSEEILYKYIAKYASKCEYNSLDYTEVLETVLNSQIFEDEHCKKVIRRLIIKTCAEHDYSAQEVIYLIMGYPLYNCSRDFVILNLNNKNWHMLSNFDGQLRNKSFMERYVERPLCHSSLSLVTFAKRYYYHSNRIVCRKKEAIVRIFPRFKKLILDYEDLFNACIFYVPWRDLDEFHRHEDELKQMLEIQSVDIDNLEDSVLEFEDEDIGDLSDSEDQKESTDLETKKLSYLSNFKPSVSTKNKGKEKLNSFDWGYGAQKYDYNLVQNCVNEIKDLKQTENVQHMDYSSLSEEQLNAFSYFKMLLKGKQTKGKDLSRRIIIQGKAGSGKSYLLNCMKQYTHEVLGSSSYVALGPTGVASRNINGSTLHSFFRFPRRVGNFHRLTGNELHLFQSKHKDLKVVFIDEYSMVGLKLLSMCDRRCRELKDIDEPFGNLIIILLGDIYQLGPVGDKSLFDCSNLEHCSTLTQSGKSSLDTFQKTFILQNSQRFDDAMYSSFLDRLALGCCTVEDWKMINKRVYTRIPEKEKPKFNKALKICSVNDDVKAYNNDELQDLDQPIAVLKAKNNNSLAFKSSDTFANGLSNVLYFSIGSRVMLKHNLNVKYGLVNGTLGKITDILYDENMKPPNLPTFIIVKFDDVEGFPYLNGGIPIKPIHCSWHVNHDHCSRVQFPLALSWACTIHKSQGLTIKVCEVDLGLNDFQIGLTYVALSRVKNAKSLKLVKSVSVDRLNSVKSSNMYVYRESFVDWLKTLL